MDAETLASLYAAGATTRELAAQIGVCPQTIRTHLRRAGVELRPGGVDAPRRPSAELTERRQRAVELYARGLGTADVARELGVSAKTVRRHLRHASVELLRRVKPSTLQRRRRAVGLYVSGSSITAIARELQCHDRTVAGDLRREGVALRGRMPLGDGWIAPAAEHGRESSYTNHRCRCNRCRRAASEARRAREERARR